MGSDRGHDGELPKETVKLMRVGEIGSEDAKKKYLKHQRREKEENKR